MKVLYIGKKITNPVSGADQVNFRNQKLLEQIVESGVDYFFEDSKGGIGKYCFGVSKSFIDMLNSSSLDACINFLFLHQKSLLHLEKLLLYNGLFLHFFL